MINGQQIDPIFVFNALRKIWMTVYQIEYYSIIIDSMNIEVSNGHFVQIVRSES